MTTPGAIYPRGQTIEATATWAGVGTDVDETLTAVSLALVAPDGTSSSLTADVTTTRDSALNTVTGTVVYTIPADAQLGTWHLHWTCTSTGGGGISGTYHEWFIARLP